MSRSRRALGLHRGGETARAEFALEMPVHLLRALYARDRWGMTWSGPPRSLGVPTQVTGQRPDLASPWTTWWEWLTRLEVTDDRLRDRPDGLAEGSLCPPAVHALLAEEAESVALWTSGWRRRFANEILTAGTDVERQLARRAPSSEGLLTIRVLPLVDPWLTWVSPRCLLVSEKMRESPETYATQAQRNAPRP